MRAGERPKGNPPPNAPPSQPTLPTGMIVGFLKGQLLASPQHITERFSSFLWGYLTCYVGLLFLFGGTGFFSNFFHLGVAVALAYAVYRSMQYAIGKLGLGLDGGGAAPTPTTTQGHSQASDRSHKQESIEGPYEDDSRVASALD